MGEWVEELPHGGKGEVGEGDGIGALWRNNWKGRYHLKYKRIKRLIKKELTHLRTSLTESWNLLRCTASVPVLLRDAVQRLPKSHTTQARGLRAKFWRLRWAGFTLSTDAGACQVKLREHLDGRGQGHQLDPSVRKHPAFQKPIVVSMGSIIQATVRSAAPCDKRDWQRENQQPGCGGGREWAYFSPG